MISIPMFLRLRLSLYAFLGWGSVRKQDIIQCHLHCLIKDSRFTGCAIGVIHSTSFPQWPPNQGGQNTPKPIQSHQILHKSEFWENTQLSNLPFVEGKYRTVSQSPKPAHKQIKRKVRALQSLPTTYVISDLKQIKLKHHVTAFWFFLILLQPQHS